MRHVQQVKRTRFSPGPLVAIAVIFLVLTTSTVRAHDPGLSALDVVVGRETIVVSLSMASVDVALVASGSDMDRRETLLSFAREAIRVSIDGDALASIDEEASADTAGARVSMTFAVRAPRDRVGQLIIMSDVPKRLARGHREFAIVYVGDDIAAKKLLDERSDSVAVDLRQISAAAPDTAWSFLKLGNQHILSGYDHLLFLAGLFLAASTVAQLLALLTAFTVAHSISLALVVLAGVHLPASIVEPLIAASIAWVGIENLIGARHRRRWLVVFGFGLIHGFGFAGALTDLGLGSSAKDVAKALFFFNAGVESGQLLVAAAILPLLWTIRSRSQWQTKLQPVCSALIVIAGGYWLFARLM